jgi:DNA-binding response OmpR family regulator
MLPVLNGLDTIREIRKHSRVPVIMLTAKGGGADRIVGLELGADDYIAKPFDPRELLARIRAVLRRADPSPTTSLLKADDLVLRPESRSAYLKGEEIELTSFEFDVVSILVSRLGQVVSRHELSAQLGRQLLPLDRSIDMHIVSLRRKLGPSPLGRDRIKTVRGTGYMFVPDGARG